MTYAPRSETGCFYCTMEGERMNRIDEVVDSNNKVQCKFCKEFNTNRQGYYKNKYQIIWCYDCGKSFQTTKIKDDFNDETRLLKLLNSFLKSNAETNEKMVLFENSLAEHIGKTDRYDLSDVMDQYIDHRLGGSQNLNMGDLKIIIKEAKEKNVCSGDGV